MKFVAFTTVSILLASLQLGFTAGEELGERRRTHEVHVRHGSTNKPRTKTKNVPRVHESEASGLQTHVRGSNIVDARDGQNFHQKEPCVVLLEKMAFEDGHEEERFTCELRGEDAEFAGADPGYPVFLVFIEGVDLHSTKPDFVSGVTTLLVEGPATLIDHRLVVSDENKLLFGELPHRRRLYIEKTGTLRTLIVRVRSKNGQPSLNRNQLSVSVFGSASDLVNFKSVAEGCSWGQVNIVPATGAGIVNGVLEFHLNELTQNVDPSISLSGVQMGLYTMFSDFPFDLVMVALPENSGIGGWSAFAYGGSPFSVYHNKVASFPHYQMHEVGHCWGLGHANEEGAPQNGEYGDRSGQMGWGQYHPEKTHGNKMCYNAYHSYELGWYSEYNVDLDPVLLNEEFDGKLAGVGKGKPSGTGPNDEKIVVSLSSVGDGYYVMFNHKIGPHEGTAEAWNQVTVIRTEHLYGSTWLEAKLSAGEKFHVYDTWQSVYVAIEVVSIDSSPTGFAHVRIYKDPSH